MRNKKHFVESFNFLGVWTKSNNEFIKKDCDFRLLVLNRKHQTENKPIRYILIKHQTQQIEYLSGIFPTDENNKFRIDYKGKNYIVTFTENTIFSIGKK